MTAELRLPFPTPPALDADPDGLRALADHEVARARLYDGTEVWAALSYAAVRGLFTDPRFTTSPPRGSAAMGGLEYVDPLFLMTMPPQQHARVRGLISKAFTPRAVDRLRPWLAGLVEELLDDLVAAGPPADFVRHVSAPLPIKVICRLLGVPEDDQEKFRGWAERTMSVTAHSPEEIAAAGEEIRAYFRAAIADKRERPGDDLITRLVAVRDQDGALAEDELLHLLQLMLVAGHETVLSQSTLSLVTLFRHPDQLAALAANPALVPGAVDELLRYVKLSALMLVRYATEDVELGGQLIEAGAAVMPMPCTANRDPVAYADPNRLDVTRTTPRPHLSFGAGPHFCVGARLARVELELTLTSLVSRLPGLRPAVGETELAWHEGGLTRRVKELPVAW